MDACGYIAMSPGGPDLVQVKTSTIPKHLCNALSGCHDVGGKKLLEKIRNKVPTLYVLDGGKKRTDIEATEKDKYWIPCSGGKGNIPR